MMTLEEEGAYMRLLCYCWQHGDIPDDPEKAARLIGKGASTTLATTVLTMFQPSDNQGRMVHDRLEAEKAKQAEWRAKSVIGGQKSAEKRKQKATTVQPPLKRSLQNGTNQKATLHSSSPSPSLPFNSKEFVEIWNEFVEMRKRMKKPVSDISINANFRDFVKWGESKSIEAITASVKGGYQGIFEPNQKPGSPKTVNGFTQLFPGHRPDK
jgi:uncharacterized protein YdaU (DUF1376 family)